MPYYPVPTNSVNYINSNNICTYHTSAYTANSGDVILADTSSGSWTLTLPVNPSSGNKIDIYTANDFSVNNLLINLNGSKLDGNSPTSVKFTKAYSQVSLIYKNSTVGWIDYPYGQLSQFTSNVPATLFGSSLIAWYRADTVTQSGNAVSAWTDLSGNGNHATQSTGSLQPIYNATGFNGKPVLKFANTYWLQMPNCLQSSWGQATLFCLYNLTDQTQQVSVMHTGSNGNGQYWSSNSQFGYASYFGEFRTSRLNAQPTNLGSAGQELVEVVSGTSAYNIYHNTVLSYSTTPSWGVSTSPYIGRSSETNRMNGDIAEVIIVNRAATDSERAQIEQYMKSFWNLTIY